MAKTKIICRGYGSPHGYAHGRHWFVCQLCRWYRIPQSVEKESRADRQARLYAEAMKK